MALFPSKKAKEQDLTPQEKRDKSVKREKVLIGKKTERKILIEKYRSRAGVYIKWSLIGLGAVILIIVIGVVVNGIINRPEPPPPPPPPEEPPEDFSIDVAEADLIQTDKSGKQYDVLVLIQDTDPDWGVSELKYTINLLNKLGNVVGSRSRAVYILPQEEKSIVEIGITTEGQAEKVEVELAIVEVQKLKDYKRPDIQLRGVMHDVERGKSKVKGQVFNNSPYSFDEVEINIIIYNAANEPIAVNYTNLNGFLSESEREFSALWADVIPEDEIDRIVVETYVDLFKTSTFMNSYSSGGSLEY